MTEHVIAFLQISAQLAGQAFEGLTQSPAGAVALLSATALVFAVVHQKQSATPELGGAVLPDTPVSPWEGSPGASVGAVVDDSRGLTAGSVLALETPGGGE
jgi:hypothetical protein